MGRNVNADFHEKQTVNIKKKNKHPQIEFSSSLLLRFTHQFEDCGLGPDNILCLVLISLHSYVSTCRVSWKWNQFAAVDRGKLSREAFLQKGISRSWKVFFKKKKSEVSCWNDFPIFWWSTDRTMWWGKEGKSVSTKNGRSYCNATYAFCCPQFYICIVSNTISPFT